MLIPKPIAIPNVLGASESLSVTVPFTLDFDDEEPLAVAMPKLGSIHTLSFHISE